MRKTALLSTVALLAGIGLASAQAPGQGQSGTSSQAQSQRHEGSTASQRHEGSTAQQTKEQAGQGRHEQSATQGRHEQGAAQNMPGKSGTAAQSQRNEGNAQRQQTTGQNLEKQKPAARAEGNRERATGQGGQSASQPQQTPQRHGQQIQQGTQGRTGQQVEQRQLSPQQGQGTTGAASQQQGQARSGVSAQQQTGQAGRAGNATVTLNESQRTRVRETVFARSDVPRVDHVDFALTVGTFVPESVHLVAVPDPLWEIRPEWREDMYFVSGDDVIIVDHSHRIMAIVAAGPSTAMNSREYRSYASARGASVSMSAAEIRQVQIALNQKGFNVGEPDGVMGPRTREALIAFQKQQGFQANGQLDQQTFAALGVSGNNAGAASTGQGGAASSTGQGGTSNLPAASQNGSSNRGSNMPSATSGQGGTGGTNMPSRTQGNGSRNLPSGQAR